VPEYKPESALQTGAPSDPNWVRLEEALGAPDNPRAWQRARELEFDGWELLEVHFESGVWSFRLPHTERAENRPS
jgi:hypothetical protein